MLVPFAPLLIALSAASPIYKGQLSGQDHWWEIFEKATDGRTPAEQDPDSNDFKVKPRFSSATRYISNHDYVRDDHFDHP